MSDQDFEEDEAIFTNIITDKNSSPIKGSFDKKKVFLSMLLEILL